MTRYLALALVLATACKDKDKAPAPSPSVVAPPPTAERPRVTGPAIVPTITKSVTFVTPKDSKFWGEANFACYRAVMGLSGKASAGAAFEDLSPNVVPAMQLAGIDLGRDLAAIGGYEYQGTPQFYVAAHIAQPDKLSAMLARLLPDAKPTEVSPGHWSIKVPGANGERVLHVRAYPIDWATSAGTDAWSQEAAKATHVIFISGVDGSTTDAEPLPLIADTAAASKRIREVESVLGDASNRCIIADVGARDFQPGFKLERGRFAIGAPPSVTPDPLMKLFASEKTLDVEVNFALTPAPKPADAEAWITMGKAFMSGIGDNVRQQFAGQGPLMTVYFDMISLIGLEAFKYEITGNDLRLSWRTNRIPAAHLEELDKRLQALIAQPKP